MKLTHILAKILKKNKINYIFGLQGGAVVHIFDSLEKYKLNVTYTHHEQSASLASVSNAKITGQPSCTVVTTGPATTNAMTGLLAAWQDSVPVIFISGQARSNHTSYGKKVRQVGTQEVNICDIVKPITKQAILVKDPNKFPEVFQKAINIANSGRKGPVWIDIPLEFQWMEIKTKKLNKFFTKKNKINTKDINSFKKLFLNSKNPLAILGYGVRSSKYGLKELTKFINKTNLPFVTTWNGKDFFSSNHKLNVGTIGMSGQRGANKAVFESDLIICLGTHLSIPHTTTLYDSYAKKSKKIIINIDNDQLKNLNIKFDLKLNYDVASFLMELNRKKIKKKVASINKYQSQNWYTPREYKNYINSNLIVRDISEKLKNKCIIVDGGGTALYSGFQSSVLENKDRIVCSSAISSMGTGLAETIGVAKTKKFINYLCIIGDGSFLMNIQDLQNISESNEKILILLVNNNGYLAIRHTQKEFLSSKFYGTHPDWKLKMPNFEKIIKSFKIDYIKIKNKNDYQKNKTLMLNIKRPTVAEIITSPEQESLFKQGYKDNKDGTFSPMDLSEMFPFVPNPISNTNN